MREQKSVRCEFADAERHVRASLIAVSNRLDAKLTWTTITKLNHYGFEIDRRSLAVTGNHALPAWTKMAFVPRSGTASSPHEYSFTDGNLTPARYGYRINQIDRDGTSKYLSTAEVGVGTAPKTITLSQNYPNPFNPTTNIRFTVPTNGRAVLKIFNTLGQEVATLVNETRNAGEYSVQWNASALSSGIYFYRLQAGNLVEMKKMLLVK